MIAFGEYEIILNQGAKPLWDEILQIMLCIRD